MKVIFGLGNPGKKYENTRHNSGFMFMDAMREFLGWDQFYDVGDWERERDLQADICEAKAGNDVKMLLVKPVTFMNRTGESARRIEKRLGVDIDRDFVLVHDDLDLKFGKIKIQRGVSPKCHRGVDSVEKSLSKKDFWRVRIGVDSREGDRSMEPDDYVLMKMKEDEVELMKESLSDGVKLLRDAIEI